MWGGRKLAEKLSDAGTVLPAGSGPSASSRPVIVWPGAGSGAGPAPSRRIRPPQPLPCTQEVPQGRPMPPRRGRKRGGSPGVSPGASQPHRVVLAAGSVRRGRQEMVKALVVARGFVIFLWFSSPKKKKNGPNAKATPQEGAGCVLGLLLPKPAQKKKLGLEPHGQKRGERAQPGCPKPCTSQLQRETSKK